MIGFNKMPSLGSGNTHNKARETINLKKLVAWLAKCQHIFTGSPDCHSSINHVNGLIQA